MPFFEREGGKQVLTYINKGVVTCLSVWTIDRLGKNLRDILNTIHFFNERNIPIIFVSQGLRTIDENGKENAITKLMISILGTVSEMEKSQIKESQLEGIRIAKLKRVFIKDDKKEHLKIFTLFWINLKKCWSVIRVFLEKYLEHGS